jgi:hypothetical protein
MEDGGLLMSQCKLCPTTGKGAPPVLILYSGEERDGFDVLYLSVEKARAIVERIEEIREFSTSEVK